MLYDAILEVVVKQHFLQLPCIAVYSVGSFVRDHFPMLEPMATCGVTVLIHCGMLW